MYKGTKHQWMYGPKQLRLRLPLLVGGEQWGVNVNKYLMMSAAAALATTAAGTGATTAASYSVHYGTSSGASYCDGLIGNSVSVEFVAKHTYTHCGYSHNIQDIGLAEKQKGDPVGKKNVVFSDQTFAFFYGNENYAILFDIQNPIQAGNKWDLWVYPSGSAASGFVANGGILLPGQFAKHRPGHKSPNTVSKLLESMKAKVVVEAK